MKKTLSKQLMSLESRREAVVRQSRETESPLIKAEKLAQLLILDDEIKGLRSAIGMKANVLKKDKSYTTRLDQAHERNLLLEDYLRKARELVKSGLTMIQEAVAEDWVDGATEFLDDLPEIP